MHLPGRYPLMCLVLSWGLGSVPAEAERIQVTIDQFVFSPGEIGARVGDTIEWINKDIAHTATVPEDRDCDD